MPTDDNDNQTEETPLSSEEPRRANTTGPLALLAAKEGFRAWLRIILGICVGGLLFGDIILYSVHQALQAKVENQDRRIVHLDKVVTDLLLVNENAERVEKIEQQVDSIGSQVQELTAVLKLQKAEEEATESETGDSLSPK